MTPVLNQKEFAQLLGVNPPTVTKWKQKGWLCMAGDNLVHVERSKERLLQMRGSLRPMKPAEARRSSYWSDGPHLTTTAAWDSWRKMRGDPK